MLRLIYPASLRGSQKSQVPLPIFNPLQIRVAAIYKWDSLVHTFFSVLVLWQFKRPILFPEKMHCPNKKDLDRCGFPGRWCRLLWRCSLLLGFLWGEWVMFHVHRIGLGLNPGSPTHHLNGTGDGPILATSSLPVCQSRMIASLSYDYWEGELGRVCAFCAV